MNGIRLGLIFCCLFFSITCHGAWEKLMVHPPAGNGNLSVLVSGGDYLVSVSRQMESFSYSRDGLEWKIFRAPMRTLHGVCYDGENFVGCTFDGYLVKFRPEAPRILESRGNYPPFWSITSFQNQFVAVANNGVFTISNHFPKVVYQDPARRFLGAQVLNGQVFAAGENGLLVSSPDLKNWKSHQLGTLSNCVYGTYAFQKYFFACAGGNLASSPDGIQWSTQNMGFTNHLLGITSTNGLAVITVDGPFVLLSTNGTDWAPQPLPSTEPLRSVVYHRDRFVAVGQNGQVAESPDAKTWTIPAKGGPEGMYAMAEASDGLIVVVGEQGRVLTSRDGQTWHPQNTGVSNLLAGVAYGNGRFMAIGRTSLIDRQPGILLQSTNGTNWQTVVTIPPSFYYDTITYGNGSFVIGAQAASPSSELELSNPSQGFILSSTDGLLWNQFLTAPGVTITGISFTGTYFLAVGSQGTGTNVFHSPDGINWQGVPSGLDFLGICHHEGSFYAAHTKGFAVSSDDGLTWTTLFTTQNTGLVSLSAYQNSIATSTGWEWTLPDKFLNARTSQEITILGTGFSQSSLWLLGSEQALIRINPDIVPKLEMETSDSPENPKPLLRIRDSKGVPLEISDSADGLHWHYWKTVFPVTNSQPVLDHRGGPLRFYKGQRATSNF